MGIEDFQSGLSTRFRTESAWSLNCCAASSKAKLCLWCVSWFSSYTGAVNSTLLSGMDCGCIVAIRKMVLYGSIHFDAMSLKAHQAANSYHTDKASAVLVSIHTWLRYINLGYTHLYTAQARTTDIQSVTAPLISVMVMLSETANATISILLLLRLLLLWRIRSLLVRFVGCPVVRCRSGREYGTFNQCQSPEISTGQLFVCNQNNEFWLLQYRRETFSALSEGSRRPV